MKKVNVYQLWDYEKYNLLIGSVIIKRENKKSFDELCLGWTEFNQLEEHELDYRNIKDFISWFNENYVTQIKEATIRNVTFL